MAKTRDTQPIVLTGAKEIPPIPYSIFVIRYSIFAIRHSIFSPALPPHFPPLSPTSFPVFRHGSILAGSLPQRGDGTITPRHCEEACPKRSRMGGNLTKVILSLSKDRKSQIIKLVLSKPATAGLPAVSLVEPSKDSESIRPLPLVRPVQLVQPVRFVRTLFISP